MQHSLHTRKRLLATVLTAAMACSLPTVAAQAEQQPADTTIVKPAEKQDIASGEFAWGFRKSLVRYIEGPISSGKIETLGQASRGKNGFNTDFSFPVDTASSFMDSNGNGRLNLKGGLHFMGHYNQSKRRWDLDVTLDNLWLDIQGTSVTVRSDFVTTGDLSVAPDSLDLKGKDKTSGSNVALASFTLDSPIVFSSERGGKVFINQDSAVTAAGFQQAFLNSKYAPGKPLDGPNLSVITDPDKEADTYGKETSVDSENRTGVIVGSVVGVLALVGAIVAGLKHFGPQFGIRLPF